jgi:hypothetical protein
MASDSNSPRVHRREDDLATLQIKTAMFTFSLGPSGDFSHFVCEIWLIYERRKISRNKAPFSKAPRQLTAVEERFDYIARAKSDLPKIVII